MRITYTHHRSTDQLAAAARSTSVNCTPGGRAFDGYFASVMVQVHADFIEDVRVQLLAFIDAGGIVLPDITSRSASDVAATFFALKQRLLTLRPREVLHSQTLQGQALTPLQSTVIAEISRRAGVGEPLQPFLSRQVTQRPDSHDALLNEWGFYHFHLGGVIPEADGYMPRSGPLLFAYATPEQLLLAAVGSHRSFVDDELLQILHDNWPEAIAEHRAVGVSRCDGDERHSPEFRRMARRGGFTIISEVNDGTLYFPPGGGYMQSGLSSHARIASDELLTRAKAAEDNVRARAAEIADEIHRMRGIRLRELHLNLLLEEPRGLAVVETQSKTRMAVR